MIFFGDLLQYFDGLMPQLMHTESIYNLFHFSNLLLFFYFLTIQEILFMILYILPLLSLVLWRL